jgi:hypothetical protein
MHKLSKFLVEGARYFLLRLEPHAMPVGTHTSPDEAQRPHVFP